MRLLAYGGTSLVERCRFGQWPHVPAGALGDKYSLVGSELSYGVGLLQGKNPFLILRQRQNLDNRGGYAFTLFLDPGSEIWKAFEWNGASLALAFLQDALGQKLLTRPEDCTEREISERLRELQTPSRPSENKRTDLQELWVGVILTNKRVVVSPHDAGFERRPSIETVAASLAALQPCFRCCDGWLVGGSKEHGEAFGARLIFDEGAPDNPEKSDLMNEGQKTLTYWNAVAGTSTFRETMEDKSGTPVFMWNKRFHESPKDLLRGVEDVALYLIGGKDAAEQPPNYDGSQFDVHRARYDAALTGTDLLNKALTRLVVSDHFERGWTIPQDDIRRLYPQTLIDELAERRKRPIEADTRMKLRAEIRFEVWQKLLEVEGKMDSIPSLVKDAIQDLRQDSLKHVVPLSQISELAKAAIDRTSATCPNLQIWVDFRDDRTLQPFIDERLRMEVLRRAIEGVADWVLDYLAFGNDEGGTLLAQFALGHQQVPALVTELVTEVQSNEKLSQEAQKWLVALATSRLRLSVPLQKKIEIAKTFDAQWSKLHVLWQLYCGQEPGEDANLTSPTDVERDALRGELRQMVKTQRVGSAVPDLQGIIELLGDLSSEEADMLAELRPPLTWRSAGRWLQGWRTLNREEVYQRELVRLLRLREGIPEDFSLDQLEDESLREVIADALAGGDESKDDSSRGRLVNLLNRKAEDGRVGAVISSTLRDVVRDGERARVLARRFKKRSHASELLIGRIEAPLQGELIALFAESNYEQFLTETYKLYREALDSKRPLHPFDRAVLRFLRTDRGERFKNQIGTWYYNFLEAGDINENLRRLLNEPAAERPDENLEETYWSIYEFFVAPIKNYWSYLFESEEEAKTESPTEALTEPGEGKGEESKSVNSERGVDESADSDEGDS
jgi:hypothetical protein